MKPNESLPDDAVGRFRTTHLSVVLLSAQTQVPGSQTAEKIFDARWAMTLLSVAGKRLREEYVLQGKAGVVDILQPFLDPTNCQRSPTYEEAAAKLEVSLGGVKTLIHRLRKRYQEILREEVARTVTDLEDVDEEIHALCETLIASEGRLGP